MASVTAPLLSLGARGQFAKTMVASVWKGISTMRHYVVPSNPQTAAQTTVRNYMTSLVAAWRNYFTNAEGRAAWNRAALYGSSVMSGFNAFVKNAMHIIQTDADASFCNIGEAIAGQHVKFTMKNLDDGGTGDEAGNFEIWVGSQPDSLLLSESVAIAGGVITGTADLGDADDVVFCKVRKGGADRSGISQVTLLA